MIETIKYIEDDWDKFEEGLKFFLRTYDEILKREKEVRFKMITEKYMIDITTIDPYKDSEYFIAIEREYGNNGLSIDETIKKIKSVLMSPKIKKTFLKKKGDGYDYCFNHSDGFVKTAFCVSYNNSRSGIVFGLSHIYYGN